jgi:hypothetical protein
MSSHDFQALAATTVDEGKLGFIAVPEAGHTAGVRKFKFRFVSFCGPVDL